METREGSTVAQERDKECYAIHKRLQRRMGTTIAAAVLVATLGASGIIKSNQESPFPSYESAKKTLTALADYRHTLRNPGNTTEVTYRPGEINPILEGSFSSLSQYATSLDNIVASVREDIETMESKSPEIKEYLARQNKIKMAGSSAFVGALGIVLVGAKVSGRKREKEFMNLINREIQRVANSQ